MEQQGPKTRDVLAQERTDLAAKRTTMAADRSLMAKKRTDLAAKRTIMAADRSLMAWIRTGLSLIGFGFTIYKFLQYMRDEETTAAMRTQRPRNIGLFLIALGITSILLGTIQYWRTQKGLDKEHGATIWRFPLIVASLIVALGLFLFITIIANAEVF